MKLRRIRKKLKTYRVVNITNMKLSFSDKPIIDFVFMKD